MSREEHRQAVLRVVEPDLVTGEDGYQVYWPHKAAGFLRSQDLRVIAEELDRRNEPWDRQVQEDLGDREGEG